MRLKICNKSVWPIKWISLGLREGWTHHVTYLSGYIHMTPSWLVLPCLFSKSGQLRVVWSVREWYISTRPQGGIIISGRTLTCFKLYIWLKSWSIIAALSLRIVENRWGKTKFSMSKCCKKGCPYHQVSEIYWVDCFHIRKPLEWHHYHWILHPRYPWYILWYPQRFLFTLGGEY